MRPVVALLTSECGSSVALHVGDLSEQAACVSYHSASFGDLLYFTGFSLVFLGSVGLTSSFFSSVSSSSSSSFFFLLGLPRPPPSALGFPLVGCFDTLAVSSTKSSPVYLSFFLRSLLPPPSFSGSALDVFLPLVVSFSVVLWSSF